MQPPKDNIIKGVIAAVQGPQGDDGWRGFFDLQQGGLKRSFYALGLSIPLYLTCAFIASQNAVSGTAIPLPAIAVILVLYVLTFPIFAYLLCQFLGKMELFRPWVIVRNWANLALVSLMAALMALSLIGLPYGFVTQLALLAYIATLILDIRLCQTILNMEWIPAIFTGCGISIMGLIMLMTGFASLL